MGANTGEHHAVSLSHYNCVSRLLYLCVLIVVMHTTDAVHTSALCAAVATLLLLQAMEYLKHQ
jgi:hypothetical protein